MKRFWGLSSLVCGVLWAGAAQAEVKCGGAGVPDGSKRVKDAPKEECRFISSMNWDETVKFLGRNTSSSNARWHREVNIPAAKYRHLENLVAKSSWEGLNVYMLGQGEGAGEVRIYVVPRPPPPAKPKKKGKG